MPVGRFNPGMNSTPLVRAVVEALMFFEHAADDEIDPDVAVRGIEVISHELEALSPADRAEFRHSQRSATHLRDEASHGCHTSTTRRCQQTTSGIAFTASSGHIVISHRDPASGRVSPPDTT
jgi:hypothetical protein